jgi:hypothetical protein
MHAISAFWGGVACGWPSDNDFRPVSRFQWGNSRFPQISQSVTREAKRCALPAVDGGPGKDPHSSGVRRTAVPFCVPSHPFPQGSDLKHLLARLEVCHRLCPSACARGHLPTIFSPCATWLARHGASASSTAQGDNVVHAPRFTAWPHCLRTARANVSRRLQPVGSVSVPVGKSLHPRPCRDGRIRGGQWPGSGSLRSWFESPLHKSCPRSRRPTAPVHLTSISTAPIRPSVPYRTPT